METTISSRQSTLLGKDTDTCIVLLERNNQDLLLLKNQLNCYTCEPKTYRAYEQFVTLKERLHTSFAHNLDMINSLQRMQQLSEEQVETVQRRILEFNELKRGVHAYRNLVRNA